VHNKQLDIQRDAHQSEIAKLERKIRRRDVKIAELERTVNMCATQWRKAIANELEKTTALMRLQRLAESTIRHQEVGNAMVAYSAPPS
jgi:chaperonin cofactor prefoldin